MATAAIPTSDRDRIWAVIARTAPDDIQPQRRLEDAGTAVAVDLVLRLEETFHILIDMDEVLPDGTFASLAALAELRIRARGVQPTPPEPAKLIDLAAARVDRARRARSEAPALSPRANGKTIFLPPPVPVSMADVVRWRRIVGLLAGTAFAAGAFGGLVYFVAEAGWLS